LYNTLIQTSYFTALLSTNEVTPNEVTAEEILYCKNITASSITVQNLRKPLNAGTYWQTGKTCRTSPKL
jgi:hypothetical protein